MTRRSGKLGDKLFRGLSLSAVVIPLVVLLLLVVDVVQTGAPRLSWDFLTEYPSRVASSAGIRPGLVGSWLMVTLTALLALPLGVGAAIYLEEYGKRSRVGALIEVAIGNLAGVPSVIYGILGLGLFVRGIGLGNTVIAGAATMALLVLPVVILASREALRTVPQTLREASYALGATRWQTIRRVVLPMALPGILTGAILSVSRAIGETAPLIIVGAAVAMHFDPGLTTQFTVLPLQIFNWVGRPQHDFLVNAAAAIIVLLVIIVALNAGAIWLRDRLQQRNR